MVSKHPAELLHGDPLSPATRKTRRSLLGLSTVGIILSITGISPSEISALGFTFTEADVPTLLTICGIVIFYLLCAFLLYAFPDIWVWRITVKQQFERALQERFMKPLKEQGMNKVVQKDADAEATREEKVQAETEKLAKKVMGEASESSDKMFFPFIRHTPARLRNGMHFLRIGFEFLLPILLAIYSIYLLFSKAQDIIRL